MRVEYTNDIIQEFIKKGDIEVVTDLPYNNYVISDTKTQLARYYISTETYEYKLSYNQLVHYISVTNEKIKKVKVYFTDFEAKNYSPDIIRNTITNVKLCIKNLHETKNMIRRKLYYQYEHEKAHQHIESLLSIHLNHTGETKLVTLNKYDSSIPLSQATFCLIDDNNEPHLILSKNLQIYANLESPLEQGTCNSWNVGTQSYLGDIYFMHCKGIPQRDKADLQKLIRCCYSINKQDIANYASLLSSISN